MEPKLSMNTMSGTVDLNEMKRRAEVYEAQRRENGGRSPMVGDARDTNAVGRDYEDGPHGVALYQGTAQMPRAPGKMFTRETICAIIRAEKTHPQTEESLATLNRLQSTFENLE